MNSGTCNPVRTLEKREQKCDEHVSWLYSNPANRYTTRQFCPDAEKSEFQISGTAFDLVATCGHLDPINKCQSLHNELYGNKDCDNPELTEEAYASMNCPTEETVRNLTARYSDCTSAAQREYSACVATNMNRGGADCYCKSDGEFFRFDTAQGTWKCTPCSSAYPPDFVQDRSTGTSCKKPQCTFEQTWDETAEPPRCVSRQNCTPGSIFIPALNRCRNCPNDPAEAPDPVSGVCRKVCAPGMKADAATNLCVCAQFPGSPMGVTRAPAKLVAIPGMTTLGWEKFPDGIRQSTAFDSSIGCVCATAQASLLDSADAVASPDSVRSPYGMVALLVANSAPTDPSQYVCGCPNYNEKFQLDPALGKYRCLPSIRDAAGGFDPRQGLTLAPMPMDPAQTDTSEKLRRLGVLDSQTDRSTSRAAMLRNPASGVDLGAQYYRRVWKCAEGYELSPGGSRCESIAANPARLAQENCADNTTVPSSSYLRDTLQPLNPALPPVDPVAKFPFLTNRRMACCLGKKALTTDPTKFHCLQSQPNPQGTFEDFYNAGASGGLDFAGVTHPNRLFLRDANGTAVSGVYTKFGNRCTVFDGMKPTQQLQALEKMRENLVANSSLNPFREITGVTANETLQADCRFLVRSALEVTCPNETPDPTTGNLRTISYPKTDATYYDATGRARRCFQPETMRVHYAIEDFSVPGKGNRTILRTISSIGRGNEPASVIDVTRLIRQGP